MTRRELVRWKPYLDIDEAEHRAAYLWKGTHDEVRGNYKKASDRTYFSRVRAVLNEFVTTPLIDENSGFVKPLSHNYGDPALSFMWEFKVLLTPQARFFGRFIRKNVFVGFAHSFREDCDFQANMERVRDRWKAALGGELGVRSLAFGDCIE